MKCTDCGAATKIIDTQKYDTFVWRRRRCPKCNHRMNTHETVVESKQNSRVRPPAVEQPAPKPKAERKLKLVGTPPPKPQPAAVVKTTRQMLEEIRDLQSFRDDDWPD